MKVMTLLCWLLISHLLVKSDGDYSDEFAIELDTHALSRGFDFHDFNVKVIRQVIPLGNVFHVKFDPPCTDSHCKRSFSESLLRVLRLHPLVSRVENLEELEVEQRSDMELIYTGNRLQGPIPKKSEDRGTNLGRNIASTFLDGRTKYSDVSDGEYWLHTINSAQSRSNDEEQTKALDSDMLEFGYNLSEDDKYYLTLVEERQRRVKDVYFNDPEADHLWQYNNYGQFSLMNPGLDMNIYPVYVANFSGKGVVVTVIDDGLDTRHIEIIKNYDPAASLDINDPHSTTSNPRGSNKRLKIPLKEGHGTVCASVIGGEANNHFCAHGVAFNVNLGGIRMLAKDVVTDLLEAYALTHNNQYISIYSNSWGPKDSGDKTAPLSYYVGKALETGATMGRNGKGSIFLFAAGNGGMKYDHCGADGLVNSPFSIAVTAINIHGRKPAYTEECSAISITAAVGGYGYNDMYDREDIDPSLIASQVNDRCVKKFLGTSAATPLIAGCIALAFEANLQLSWRDIQHLMTISARIPNAKESVWQMNTAGFLTSHHYGFGLLDCSGFVSNAQKWKNVGERRTCIGGATNRRDNLYIRRRKKTRITFITSACESTRNSIDFLEHVMVHTIIQHNCRGDLTMILTSPTGSRSFLLKSRRWDLNDRKISFSHLSLMNWGENPRGTWYLDIIDIGHCKPPKGFDGKTGKIIEAILEFSGTQKYESALHRNKNLIEDYFRAIKLKKPLKSLTLNERQIYDVYDEQRKYFIRITPSKRESSPRVKQPNGKSKA